jgi:hypothetical protein
MTAFYVVWNGQALAHYVGYCAITQDGGGQKS